eukprot:scaffold7066_cov253-Pinguiococcus_pyrenoidosus.AAC.21
MLGHARSAMSVDGASLNDSGSLFRTLFGKKNSRRMGTLDGRSASRSIGLLVAANRLEGDVVVEDATDVRGQDAFDGVLKDPPWTAEVGTSLAVGVAEVRTVAAAAQAALRGAADVLEVVRDPVSAEVRRRRRGGDWVRSGRGGRSLATVRAVLAADGQLLPLLDVGPGAIIEHGGVLVPAVGLPVQPVAVGVLHAIGSVRDRAEVVEVEPHVLRVPLQVEDADEGPVATGLVGLVVLVLRLRHGHLPVISKHLLAGGPVVGSRRRPVLALLLRSLGEADARLLDAALIVIGAADFVLVPLVHVLPLAMARELHDVLAVVAIVVRLRQKHREDARQVHRRFRFHFLSPSIYQQAALTCPCFHFVNWKDCFGWSMYTVWPVLTS